jgi:hypothetical protein
MTRQAGCDTDWNALSAPRVETPASRAVLGPVFTERIPGGGGCEKGFSHQQFLHATVGRGGPTLHFPVLKRAAESVMDLCERPAGLRT